jgi:hypothetical protein
VGITVIDPKAKRRSNVIVTFKALGYSIELFLQRTGELFSGSLEYELVAWFLAEGLSSVECTIEYVDAVGSVANANVLLGSPLIPENVHVYSNGKIQCGGHDIYFHRFGRFHIGNHVRHSACFTGEV